MAGHWIGYPEFEPTLSGGLVWRIEYRTATSHAILVLMKVLQIYKIYIRHLIYVQAFFGEVGDGSA